MTDPNNLYGGYQDDSTGSALVYGLNAGNTYMTKFAYNANGGKDGAAQECIDIVFSISGVEKSFRQFPVTKAFDKNGNEVTDPKSKEFQDAVANSRAIMTHVMKCFVSEEQLKTALTAAPITTYAQYAQVLTSLLPPNYSEIALDIFLQWQWNIKGENTATFLEFPKKMSYGAFLCVAQPGNYDEVLTNTSLKYVNGEGAEHPFKRGKWFVSSNFATRQTEEAEAALNGGGDIPNTDGSPAWNE